MMGRGVVWAAWLFVGAQGFSLPRALFVTQLVQQKRIGLDKPNHLAKLRVAVARLDEATRYLPDQAEVVHALAYAAYAHDGQRRRSGEPFIIHPIETATILAELQLDADTVVSGLLHDTIEDTKVTLEDLRSQFGDAVATIVAGVTDSESHARRENQEALFVAVSADWRVALVKLADRLHNMRTLAAMPKPKRVRKSEETMQLFVPLAASLGLRPMEAELRRLSTVQLVPDSVALLSDKMPMATDLMFRLASRRSPSLLDEFLHADSLRGVKSSLDRTRAEASSHTKARDQR